MTLIEVIAALALLATLLVTLLQTHTGAARQAVAAREKLAAVDAADALLADWWANRAGVPINASGTTGPWQWHTSEVADASAAAIHTRIVRVQLINAQSVRPAISIDILQAIHPPVVQQ